MHNVDELLRIVIYIYPKLFAAKRCQKEILHKGGAVQRKSKEKRKILLMESRENGGEM